MTIIQPDKSLDIEGICRYSGRVIKLNITVHGGKKIVLLAAVI